MNMAHETLNDCKRPKNDYVNERKQKKKRVESESRQKINGAELQRLKKTPRLSPALFWDDCEIQHKQIYELLKYAALGKAHNAPQPSWCHIHHQKRLRNIAVIILQNLSQLHFYKFYLHFRCIRRLFKHRFRLPPQSSHFIASLVGVDQHDLTNRKTKNPDNHCKSSLDYSDLPGIKAMLAYKEFLLHPTIRKYGEKKQGLTRYLLSTEELRKNDYPVLGSSDIAHFVHSGCTGEVTDSSPLFGLDCEMCLTTRGNELTRISLVAANGQCIMDELVKPDNEILNYMTRFSGITKNMLLPVTTKLKDIQEKVKTLLPSNAVLVGHSLENDLRALQMIHANVIDTALLYAGEQGRKYRLKFLAQAVLGREIQREEVIGHNPFEDAKAALDLAQYFIQQGPGKVAELNVGKILRNINNPNGSLAAQEASSVLQHNGFIHLLNTVTRNADLPATEPSFVESLHSSGRKITYVTEIDDRNNVSPSFEHILCTSDEEVLERACNLIPVSPISVVEFCTRKINSEYNDVLEAKVKSKFAEMMTVFAGPFKKDFCLKSIKREFQSCGPIHSLSIVSETYQPFICIKYCVLEAAKLALENLNETNVNGCWIKVQSLLNCKTLDCEYLISELEEDLENKDVIYVSGFRKPLTEEFLQQQFSHLRDIKAILLPSNEASKKPARHCFLKFQSSQSAILAADYIRAQGGLRCRKALTASHLHRWIQECVNLPPVEQPHNEDIPPKEQDLAVLIKNVDRKISRLYKCLKGNSLCLVLFPGANRSNGKLPGFGFMGIKGS
ncbi:RNA exonuclease 5 isoform X1 [Pelobates cultripes]|uniref:RNA exonuclease 5 isoform X1 n=1 Tax=Pelobates cultripes TaxID=61616 RepID=A0AAD1SPJ0_PELCU|nr:RNA exonuclease 5 isoform X1 [Pelobates cultripes]